jgi:dTDP-4-amino-4,6-dideoxygalactose transaminase
MPTPLGFRIVEEFEKTIAEYAGAKYGVAVESCTAAIFLSLLYRKECFGADMAVRIPKFTYPSVPASAIHAGFKVDFIDYDWRGQYDISPYAIIDGALRFRRGMYKAGLHCLSFHAKKLLPIGRGGMILTDSAEARDWLIKARFDGRTPGVPLSQDTYDVLGWNMYLEPAQAAKGLQIFDMIKDKDLPDIDMRTQDYPDLSKLKIFHAEA